MKTTAMFMSTALVMLSAAHVEASAWTQAEGTCYAKVWTAALVGAGGFGADGNTYATKSFTDVSLQHYVECGLTRDWTLLTSGDVFGFARHGEREESYNGRLSLGIRRGLLRGPVHVSVEAEYGHQGLWGGAELAPQEAYSFRAVVPSHTGRVSAAAGIGGDGWWVTLNTGVRVFNALSPAWVGGFQVGGRPLKNLVVDLHLPYNITIGDLGMEENVSGAGNTNYVGWGLGFSYWFEDAFAINFGLDGVVFVQANAATPALQLGVEWRPSF